MNVASEAYTKLSWVVHLYAEAGDEHIYQIRAVSATNAARIALESYEAQQRQQETKTFVGSGIGSAPEYPDVDPLGIWPWR